MRKNKTNTGLMILALKVDLASTKNSRCLTFQDHMQEQCDPENTVAEWKPHVYYTVVWWQWPVEQEFIPIVIGVKGKW